MFWSRNKHSSIAIIVILFSLESCNKSTRVMIPVAQIPIEHTPVIVQQDSIAETISPTETVESLNFHQWTIGKKSLGPIHIGMQMKSVDSILSTLNKQTGLALDFGFGGGSPAYVYSIDSIPILAVVQALNSKKVFAIVAISEKFKTSTGLHPQMQVSKLLEVYPQMKFYLDYMNGWEYASDDIHQWSFIFITDKKNQIGIYPFLEKPSYAKKTLAINAWITIQ